MEVTTMLVKVHRKVKVHKIRRTAAEMRCVYEIERMVRGLTLRQLNDLTRYIRVRREV